eukprot:GHVN01067578.1.p1 GENE.GHVN01067578.1~~GHVN01067578.1.p1  ORF type:complete len:518 (-),score=52.53 GHVN01067578.1:1100-2653(-)
MTDSGDEFDDMERPLKYLFVTGGTVSGLGKGTTISSIGVLLKARGWRVTTIKIDPYLNVDAGTMSPYEHGEVYVLSDGGEADLDLGNYERFLGISLCREHNITSGKVYKEVLDKERKGDYLGKTVQMIPHVTDIIQAKIEKVAKVPVDESVGIVDVCLIEVGGTVGDIESMIYLEAIQRFIHKIGRHNVCLCHVTYVPKFENENKTKPTQHSVTELRRAGLIPDLLFCRGTDPLGSETKAKIGLMCGLSPDKVVSVHNVKNIFHVPGELEQQHTATQIAKVLNLRKRVSAKEVDQTLRMWDGLACRVDDRSLQVVRIGLVGKYTGMQDSYLSVLNSLRYAAHEAKVNLEILWIDSSDLQETNKMTNVYDEAWEKIKSLDGVLCPGGFGDRGIEGKSLAARYCRQTSTPYFGICLGMQTAVIDFCRDVLGKARANSEEFDEDAPTKAVIFMPEGDRFKLGGTMRLGDRTTRLSKSSLAYKLYDCQECITERHRHRLDYPAVSMIPPLAQIRGKPLSRS